MARPGGGVDQHGVRVGGLGRRVYPIERILARDDVRVGGAPGEAIVAWLADGRPPCDTRCVFTTVNPPGRPLSPGAIGHVVGSACRSAGIARIGAHRLRHTLATDMLRAGASLPEVGQVLRHRSARSTAIYAKVDEVALRPLSRPWPGTAPRGAPVDEAARSLARPWPGTRP